MQLCDMGCIFIEIFGVKVLYAIYPTVYIYRENTVILKKCQTKTDIFLNFLIVKPNVSRIKSDKANVL